MEGAHILLVEDDPNFGSVLCDYLEMNGFRVTYCVDGNKGYSAFKNNLFDLCLLDVMMPYKDGFSLAKDIKASGSDVPVVFLTAKNMKADVLKGFQLGADDYLTKPFDSEVLLYKIKAILHRNGMQEKERKEEYFVNDYTYKVDYRVLIYKEEERKLSPKEADLLELLCRFQNEILPRDYALSRVWKESNYFTGRSMDVYITKLRKYFKEDPSIQIINVHGQGFRLIVKA
ncbi:MAG: two-component system OmpR family response regulator [Flavobacteriales bacterium]|jgi:two-component system OmpR family response regulator